MKKLTTLLFICMLFGLALPLSAQTTEPTPKQEKPEVRCPDCNGLGRIVNTHSCTSCRGSGNKICSSCRGNGTKRVLENGKYITESCHACGGMGSNRCAICSGRGFVTDNNYQSCKRCNGVGYLYK